MKNRIIIILLCSVFNLNAATYYLSPTGNDVTGSGSISNPWFTLEKAWVPVVAGDTIYMRGGNYVYDNSQYLTGKSGVSGNMIHIFAYRNEKPKIIKATVFTYDPGWNCGIRLTADYIHVRGLEMAGFVQMSSAVYHSFLARNCSYCVFEELNLHHGAMGLYLLYNDGGPLNGNLVLNCDFHHNYDPLSSWAYGGADGIAIGYVQDPNSINTIRGCRFYYNSDDGLDCWSNEGLIIIEDCWSWHNGYREDKVTHGGDGNGIKLGAVSKDIDKHRRIVRNNLCFSNYDMGITQNEWEGTEVLACLIYNNTCYDHFLGPSYQFGNAKIGNCVNVFKNNIALNSPSLVSKEVVDISICNTWDGIVTVTADDFISIDSAGMSATRINGERPVTNFMKLKSGSDLINAGTEVGIDFRGTKPDLGCYEFLENGSFLKDSNGNFIKIIQ